MERTRQSGFKSLPPALVARFSARSLIAEIAVADRRFAACSFHATPGEGRFGAKRATKVGEWKPFFHGGVAVALARLGLPFVFAIDANEPVAETADSVTFGWAEGRAGARKLGALLGVSPKHRGRDLLREQLMRDGTAAATATYLALTYTTRNGGAAGRRRFDSIWATPEFALRRIATHYEEALAAGTDHAMLVADIEIG